MVVLLENTRDDKGVCGEPRRTVRGGSMAVRNRFSSLQWGALLCFIGLNVADVVSTLVAIRMGLVEGNYLPSLILSSGSELLMYCFKLVAVSLVVTILVKLASSYPRLWYALYASNAIMVIVVVGNLASLAEARVM